MAADTHVPEPGPDGLRHWRVAGGVLIDDHDRVLIVNNKRRNGDTDWSPPGGVIDPGESPTVALSREVLEESGLVVPKWNPPAYHVVVTAPGYGFRLEVVSHLAAGFTGDIAIDDPDGIVTAAEFVDRRTAVDRMRDGSQWVWEPMTAYLLGDLDPGHTFEYRLDGSSSSDRQVTRLDG